MTSRESLQNVKPNPPVDLQESHTIKLSRHALDGRISSSFMSPKLIPFRLEWLTSAEKPNLDFISFGKLQFLQTELLNGSSHTNAYSADIIFLLTIQKLHKDAE